MAAFDITYASTYTLHVYNFYVTPLTVRNKSFQYACLMLISAIHIITHFTNELVRCYEKRLKMDKSH